MPKTPMNVRIHTEVREALKRLATAENRTFSNLVDTALRQYIEGHPDEFNKCA
jgi:predicted transcriptional regulator